MKALFQKLINAIANEPVATITVAVAGGINWLFSHFSFLPPLPDTTRNTIVTLVVALTGWVVRQYVTPTRKVAAVEAAQATGGDGQAHAGDVVAGLAAVAATAGTGAAGLEVLRNAATDAEPKP